MLAATLLLAGAPTFRPYRHPVTIWVPPYAVAKSVVQLESGLGIGSALTHLSLQFWVPTRDGKVARANFDEATDANVVALRDWAHAHRIRAMLCVFNGENTWDWPLARAAFADHPKTFVNGLLTEMDRLRLDGVEVDLEGPNQYEADRPAYVAFLRQLSVELHARRKALGVASFSAAWNAPNQGWWPDLFPLVDSLVSMGYEGMGQKAAGAMSYAAQKRAAGRFSRRLELGLPGYKDAWAGDALKDQIGWIVRDGTMGVGVWDAQLSAPAWRSPVIWKKLATIRG